MSVKDKEEMIVKSATWVTPLEASTYLGISRSKLYELIRARQIPAASLPGRGYRLNIASLESWLRSRERAAASNVED